MHQPRILIADDSMVVRAVIRRQLGTEGYDLVEVSSGEAVLEVCKTAPPDVVLLDVEMPGLSGYDVLAAMQADEELSGIPVVFLSGRVSADDVATGLRLGAHDYLRKPVETGELLARVTAALRMRAMHERLRDNAQLRQPAPVAPVAPVDQLTGALDIRGLQEQLEVTAEESRAQGKPLAGILLDIQGLDAINRSLGWEAGDAALSRIVETVTGVLTPGEAIGRCGPDEFIVLLPGTDLLTAQTMARSLQSRIAATPVVAGTEAVTVRVSAGAAVTLDGDAQQLVRDLQDAIAAPAGSVTAAPSWPSADQPGGEEQAPPAEGGEGKRRRWNFSNR